MYLYTYEKLKQNMKVHRKQVDSCFLTDKQYLPQLYAFTLTRGVLVLHKNGQRQSPKNSYLKSCVLICSFLFFFSNFWPWPKVDLLKHCFLSSSFYWFLDLYLNFLLVLCLTYFFLHVSIFYLVWCTSQSGIKWKDFNSGRKLRGICT